ncbi:MAG: ABC transporter ATP-binding protein [Anaerolineae bacterium]|nr:ABC transporter ATP-binding protein [Anaerolineae bacterium]
MLALNDLYKGYGGTPVLRGLKLAVEDGEILCLLGPSGCGKSTALRLIAGLETPDTGTITVDGQVIINTPIHERGFGLMFQDFALFPHLNVFDNAAFGLRMHGIPKAEIQRRVSEVLELVRLAGFEKRSVGELSGGEKQRVALARSLAPEPRLLMLDEPLGSLDASLRTQLIGEIREIIKTAALTAIYVTHDRGEAFSVSDRLGLMNNGKIERIGTPNAVYDHPKTVFSAAFLGFNNLLSAQELAALGIVVEAPEEKGVRLIHPSGIQISGDQGIAMQITEAIFEGERYRLQVSKADIQLSLSAPAAGQRFEIGETVQVEIDSRWVQALSESA